MKEKLCEDSVAIVIPALNGGELLQQTLQSIKQQSFQPQIRLLMDSESTDATSHNAKRYGFTVHTVLRKDFNHGATRQQAVELVENADIIIMLTQDAILANNDALAYIVKCFEDEQVGVAYGRQLPHSSAGPLGAHARLFNYPPVSQVKKRNDISRLGIKTAFTSNSFAAYRRSALLTVGGFPDNTILSEDMYVAAKMILAGWKVAYCAEAAVYHSHDYSIWQECKRYFDIGVFHSRESWIRETFGKSEGEGLRFIRSEWRFLWKTGNARYLPSAILRTGMKYVGYRLGMLENWIPRKIKRKISMHSRYWT